MALKIKLQEDSFRFTKLSKQSKRLLIQFVFTSLKAKAESLAEEFWQTIRWFYDLDIKLRLPREIKKLDSCSRF